MARLLDDHLMTEPASPLLPCGIPLPTAGIPDEQEENSVHWIRVSGELACFTRPEFKTERVSYEIITPSAARGLLEAILWKPAIQWQIRKILLLAPPRFIQFKRHELMKGASVAIINRAANGGEPADYFAEDDRSQRNTLALRDVDYAIAAALRMTPRAGSGDNQRKFDEMFRRRLQRGQSFAQPYLGCREFPAIVGPYIGDPLPIESESRELGYMLHDIHYGVAGNRPIFFEARIVAGVVEVPNLEEVK